ncbi:MAG: hypothetical protein M0R16_04245 [Bacteroidales bacterium]|jgi:hypothetical protein|nr:hypothetical protein [Bacteroidales bacterium]
MNYLIYHPKRQVSEIGNLKVYHDSFGHNEDPYVWNKKFLHSFCHITQIKPEVGSRIFWISGDTYPDFNKLNCDCVFVVKEKRYWTTANKIEITDPIVDNEQTFRHHYNWVNPPYHEHPFKKRRRYTLKADENKSFQPQDKNQNLIDIVPFLNDKGISVEFLRSSISRTINGKHALNSRPFKLPDKLTEELYTYLLNSDIIIIGQMIEYKHPNS